MEVLHPRLARVLDVHKDTVVAAVRPTESDGVGPAGGRDRRDHHAGAHGPIGLLERHACQRPSWTFRIGGYTRPLNRFNVSYLSMKRDELGELVAFLAVCEERSFTRAAARLGTSQSALSHTVKRLEERLDLRLLTRTTRSVAPTDAGEQLAATLRPALDEIEARLDGLTALRARPAGTIRITSNRAAARDILYPKVARLMADYPDIRVEISIDQSFVDIVEQRFDAGVRLGESVERDMIAVRIGPDKRMLVAGAPAYFARHGRPRDAARPDRARLHQPAPADPRRPLRLGVRGVTAGRSTSASRGSSPATTPTLIAAAAIDGLGLCCLPDDQLAPLVADGRLETVLEDWSPPFPGYHLYYPSRRQSSRAFALLVEALRWRG